MEPGTSFTALDHDGDERFQRLRQELGVSTFGLNLIRLRPGERGRIHAHERQEEVYLVLEGTLTLEVEVEVEVEVEGEGEVTGEPRELGRGELARVAPAVRRRLANRGDERAVVLALGGAEPHVGRDGRAWESWDEPGDGRPPQDVPLPADER